MLGSDTRAQPLCEEVDSIEWMAADCALIARGTIVAVKTEQATEGGVWHTVGFRVDEMLKGDKRSTLQFLVWANTIERDVSRWKEHGRPLLVFLDRSSNLAAIFRVPKFARFSFAPRTGHAKGSFLELHPDAERRAYTLDIKELAQPDEILKAVRGAIAAPTPPGKLASSWISFPGHGDLLRVTVPVDSRLEARAREWTQSADKDIRREGATALGFFRSDANVAILNGLLEDPGAWDHAMEEGGRIVRRVRVYSVREQAYSVLKAWGYDVPEPLLRQPIPLEPNAEARRKD
jgi:hypothetical protein